MHGRECHRMGPFGGDAGALPNSWGPAAFLPLPAAPEHICILTAVVGWDQQQRRQPRRG